MLNEGNVAKVYIYKRMQEKAKYRRRWKEGKKSMAEGKKEANAGIYN